MNTVQVISIVISISAFLVAAYGIIERRLAAIRSERIRLTTIVENMSKIRLELTELSEKGISSGNIIEATNARLEVLAQQAISLVQQHSLTITSAECREIAMDLEHTGYTDDADFMWNMAHERAKKEGDTQEFYTDRGHAYFLFRQQRETSARKMLRIALSHYVADTDIKRIRHAETLTAWYVWETSHDGPSAQNTVNVKNQLSNLAKTFQTGHGKQLFAELVKGIDFASIEK